MKVRKKPVVVDAWKFDPAAKEWPPGVMKEFQRDAVHEPEPTGRFVIESKEGTMVVEPGAYVIRGVAGEMYPCAAEIFEATYEIAIEAMPVVDAEPPCSEPLAGAGDISHIPLGSRSDIPATTAQMVVRMREYVADPYLIEGAPGDVADVLAIAAARLEAFDRICARRMHEVAVLLHERDTLRDELAEHYPVAITARAMCSDEATVHDLREIVDEVVNHPAKRMSMLPPRLRQMISDGPPIPARDRPAEWSEAKHVFAAYYPRGDDNGRDEMLAEASDLASHFLHFVATGDGPPNTRCDVGIDARQITLLAATVLFLQSVVDSDAATPLEGAAS